MRLLDLPDHPLPPGAVLHEVEAGRARLRVARWPAPAPNGPGTVVVLPGRSEFIEKYAEVVGDLRERGFAVVVLDWRGQGASSRPLANPRKGHVGHFDEYDADLRAVLAAVVVPFCPPPLTALAHSMGGAILLGHLRRDRDTFARAVLSAPMIDIFGIPYPRLARLLAAQAALTGLGSLYVPGGSDAAWMARPFAGNGLTSDPRRFAVFNALAEAAPDLVLGAPTMGWLHAAFVAMRAVCREPAAIRTPLLLVACGADRVVATEAAVRFARGVAGARCVVVPEALHEILMERDALRAAFWTAFDAFLSLRGEVGEGTAAFPLPSSGAVDAAARPR